MKPKADPRVSRAVEVFKQEVTRVSAIWNVDLSSVTLRIAPRRGRILGQARIYNPVPAISTVLINQSYFDTYKNYSYILNDTFTHELAHIANVMKHGPYAKSHGPTWKLLMRAAGKEPTRLAQDIDVPASIKKSTMVAVRCACGAKLMVSKIKWNRRMRYTHVTCGNPLHLATLENENEED